MDIIEGLRDGAVAEQNDPVGDPHRNDLEIGGAAQQMVVDHVASKNAERARAMTEHRVDQGRRHVRRVHRSVGVDEIPRQVRSQEFRLGGMIGVVAGVEMGDAHPAAGRSADTISRHIELRVVFIGEPIFGIADRVDIAVGRGGVAIAGEAEGLSVGAGPNPLLLEIRLGHGDSATCHPEPVAHQCVAGVPVIDVAIRRFGNMPCRRRRQRGGRHAINAGHQRTQRECDRRRRAQCHAGSGGGTIAFYEKPKSSAGHGMPPARLWPPIFIGVASTLKSLTEAQTPCK